MTYAELDDLSKEDQIKYLNTMYTNLTEKRRDPIIDMIDCFNHFLKSSYSTHYSVYKYDMTISELRNYLYPLLMKFKDQEIFYLLKWSDKKIIKKHQVKNCIKNIDVMLDMKIRDKREVISASNNISIVIYNSNHVDILQDDKMIQSSLFDFKRWLNTNLGRL